MKIFNRLTATTVAMIALTMAPMAYCADEKGEKTVGITAGYNTRNESAVAGLFFQYRINRLLRIAPDLTYIFRNNHTDGLALNVNLHMPLPVVSDKVNFYPLAGLNYTSWSFHPKTASPAIIEGDDVTTRRSRLGLNIGGGLDIYATSTLRLFIEGKYTGVRHYSTCAFTAGIGYRF